MAESSDKSLKSLITKKFKSLNCDKQMVDEIETKLTERMASWNDGDRKRWKKYIEMFEAIRNYIKISDTNKRCSKIKSPEKKAVLKTKAKPRRKLNSADYDTPTHQLIQSTSQFSNDIPDRPVFESEVQFSFSEGPNMSEALKKVYKGEARWRNYSHQNNNNNMSIQNRSVRLLMANSNKKCFLCHNVGHAAIACNTALSESEKKAIVIGNKLCHYCLCPGHKSADCYKKNRIYCSFCRNNHPTPLHGIEMNETEINTSTHDMV